MSSWLKNSRIQDLMPFCSALDIDLIYTYLMAD